MGELTGMEELTGTQLFRSVISPFVSDGRREDVLALLDGDALRELKRLRAAAAASILYWSLREGDEELLEELARALGARGRLHERGPEGDDADAEGAGPASEGEDDRADDERRDDDREDDRVPEGYELEGYEVMTVVEPYGERGRAYTTEVPVLRLRGGRD